MNTHRFARRSLAFALVAVVALLARPRVASADEVLRDEWAVLEIGGAKVGYGHNVVRRLKDPGRIETTQTMRLVIGRLGAGIEIASDETSVEREDGRLVSIHAREKQSSVETVTDVTVDGKTAKIVTEVMGTKREAVVEIPEDVVGPYRTERVPLEAGYPVGKAFEMKVFSRELGSATTARTRVAGPEDVDLPDGKKGRLTRLDSEFDGIPQKVTTWVDEKGSTVLLRVSAGPVVIDGHRATKEEALAEGDASKPPPDVFTRSLIVSKVLVPHARAIESATIRITPRGPEAKIPDLQSDRQRVREEKGSALLVAIRRTVPPERAATRPIVNPAAELAPYLASSSTIQADDPEIAKAAAEAVSGETDAWKAAQAIERWVAENLTKKNMGVAFASALEVCRNREGDCTEHSVLAAALCRAAGIPARVVMGLEHIQGIWGGHAWTEVSVAGRWYAIDATNAHGDVDALHLTLVSTPMAEGAAGREIAALGGVIGSVDIDLLEASWNGRALPVADPAAVRADGRRYENRLYDLAFEASEGFAVEAIAPKGLETRLAKVTGKDPQGNAVEIVVEVVDLPPSGFKPPAGAATRTVDGRQAAAVTPKDGTRHWVVAVGDVAFVFTASPQGEAAGKVLDALLASVDLDPLPAKSR